MSQGLLFLIGINVLLAWSVYIIHLAGSLSFANSAFMGIGAYAAGVLTTRFGMPLWPSLIAASAVTGAFGALVAYPVLRTRGVYLIMVTVGITFLVQVALENTRYLGGVTGMGGMIGAKLWHVYMVVGLVGAGLYWLSRSHLQRLLLAVLEDEKVAALLGLNVVYLKVACFAAGAMLAALGGGLYAHFMVFINPNHFGVLIAVYVVLYVVLGGMNNMWGPVAGAILMTAVPELIRGLAEWRSLVFGLAILMVLLVRPDGLLPFRTLTARSPRGPTENGSAPTSAEPAP